VHKYIVIDVTKQVITLQQFKELSDALKYAGLAQGEVDWSGMGHTADGRHVTLMAYEFGLRPDMAGDRLPSKYCRIGNQMYAGNLVLFAADKEGDNADMTDVDLAFLKRQIEWLPDAAACEMAIEDGRVQRPQMSVNGEVMWEWSAT
jgi:hypothetical protein